MAAGPPLLTVVVLLSTAIALLIAASSLSASPVATAGNHGGGRMATIIIRAPRTSRIAAAVPSGARSKWQHDGRRRLVEDEVAPEFGGLLGAGGISTDTLIKDRAACTSNCAGKGEPYTRPCIYKNQCNG